MTAPFKCLAHVFNIGCELNHCTRAHRTCIVTRYILYSNIYVDMLIENQLKTTSIKFLIKITLIVAINMFTLTIIRRLKLHKIY